MTKDDQYLCDTFNLAEKAVAIPDASYALRITKGHWVVP